MLGCAVTAGAVTHQRATRVIPSWNVFPHRFVGAQCFAVSGYFLPIAVDNAAVLFVSPAPYIQSPAICRLPPCLVCGLVTRDPRAAILVIPSSAVCEVGEVYPGVSDGQSVLNFLVASV